MDEFKIDLEQAEDMAHSYIPSKFTHAGYIGTFDTLPVYELDGYAIGDGICAIYNPTHQHTYGGKPMTITCFFVYQGENTAGLSNGGLAVLSKWLPWKNT